MIILSGKIIKGERAASGKGQNWNGFGSIHLQMEFLKENQFLLPEDFLECHAATINIELDKDLILKNWEYFFDKIYWLPNSNVWYEGLFLMPIVFLHNRLLYKSWVYKASKSPHKLNNKVIEVIAPFIENLDYNQKCEIEIDEKYIF